MSASALEYASLNGAFKAIEEAKASQDKTNSLWFKAQVAAFQVACLSVNRDGELLRDLTPLARLVQAAVDSQSVRARELVEFVLWIGGADKDGENGAITWNAKDKVFRYRSKDAAVREGMLHEALTTPWFKWAKPENVNIAKFSSIASAIRKVRKDADAGKLILKNEEKLALEALCQVAAAHGLNITPKA